ncbi:type II toxin-antitoxin system VapC family toxin [Accumulibacter sp.]|jgi:predicted nucleic acid-binding protein|uniref:type II toxin-antitoxin system VapC family toxin n=1 Tax=Accumulibacter sp. TaxID=2053492 RepID=UPI001AC20193|nr:type II toxin-antitoxin system VapC family toxin [Accumulibacter sp.]MBN8454960.1 type II toxin-antitoxin system VapC family toxin [Accumulibacter sp.]MBO3705161.1 type II toxin-antitoxin system VapC family toxin [Candidatus Accumulibacter conexus]
MSFVLDSSVSLAWCFDDERTDAADALLERVVEAGAAAPALWPLEVLNALAMAERRSRINAERRQRLAGFLGDLPVIIDDETASQAWVATCQLAARFRLTVYDAAYLELAQRRGLPLATFDQELRAAAVALGVTLLG